MEAVTKNTVTIMSTTTVRSSAPAGDHDRRVELTPWDLQFLLVGPIQKGLLFQKPKDVTTDMLIHRLEASLSRTLDFFTPLAGRLSRTDNDDRTTASFFIDCNNAGAQLVHATAGDSVSVSDVLGAPYVPEVVISFFPLNGVGNHEGDTHPLLAVQVTELRDGVFVGCTVNHVVADGSSFWHFLNSWSEISGGRDAPTKPPSLRRWFLGGLECPVRIPLVKLRGERLYRDYRPPDLSERIFYFGKESVAELKARANSEMGTDGRISSLQAVLAHLWRSIIRSKHGKSGEEEVAFMLLVGARQRLQSLSEQYFGNAVQVANTTMKTSELVEKGVGHVAWEMNKTIGSQTQQNIETTLDHWVANPTLPIMGDMTTKSASSFASSSPRFNVYGNDFGWGVPVAVRCGAGNKSHGKITLFPGVEPGSIEVQACLLSQIMCIVEKDVEFMDMVTTP